MKEEDVDQCLNIFRDHQLATSAHGLKSFRKIDPNGCYVLTPEDDDTEIIAFVAASKFDPRCVIISFYGTKPGYQGLGLGLKIWKQLDNFVDWKAMNVGLGSSPEQIQTYKKAGLTVEDPHNMLVVEKVGPPSINEIKPTDQETSRVKVVSLDQVKWQDLLTYDADIVGFDRDKILSLSLREPDTLCLVAVDSNDGKMIGYGAMKTTNMTGLNNGFLGPLYSDDITVAKVLTYNLVTKFPLALKNGYITFMADSQKEGLEMNKRIGLQHMFTCPHLYTKEVITGINYDKVYSLLSPAFSFY